MHVHLAAPGELGPAEISTWRSMQRASPPLANPFLSPEFALAVGRFRPGARVAVLSDGTSTTGFFPFERGRLGAGAPLLSWPGTLWQGLVHAPGAHWDPRELLRKCQLSVWRFDHLVAEQGPFAPYQAGLAASPVIDLTDGFAAYHAKLQTRAARFCRDIARGSATWTAMSAPSVSRVMPEMSRCCTPSWPGSPSSTVRWASSTASTGRGSSGSSKPCWPPAPGTSAACFPPPTPETSRSRLSSGCGAGIPLAGWFTAYDPQFARHSPGLIQVMQLAEHLAACGVRTIDMGEGAAGYKEKLKSHDGYVAHGMVTSRSVLAAAHRARSVSTDFAAQAVLRSPRFYRATRRARSVLR